jgi:hypothetical protein
MARGREGEREKESEGVTERGSEGARERGRGLGGQALNTNQRDTQRDA